MRDLESELPLSYIRVDRGLERKPKFRHLVRLTKYDDVVVLAYLIRIWQTVDELGAVLEGDDEIIAESTSTTPEMIAAMCKVGWAARDGDRVTFGMLDPTSPERRRNDNERKRRSRSQNVTRDICGHVQPSQGTNGRVTENPAPSSPSQPFHSIPTIPSHHAAGTAEGGANAGSTGKAAKAAEPERHGSSDGDDDGKDLPQTIDDLLLDADVTDGSDAFVNCTRAFELAAAGRDQRACVAYMMAKLGKVERGRWKPDEIYRRGKTRGFWIQEFGKAIADMKHDIKTTKETT